VAVLPIRVLGDPVLREKAKRVTQIDEALQRLIDDMFESMYAARGVGLAAPQIGLSLRLVVIHAPEHPPFVLINPEIVRRSGEREVDEGCLSVPGYRGHIVRSVSVTAKGLNRDGKEVRIKASNSVLAQALEHETDHVNGTLYVDHLESAEDLRSIEELERETQEATEE
jgi:peptide deformylase